jgi:hypothetical protein
LASNGIADRPRRAPYRFDDTHAAPTAARQCLDDHRVASRQRGDERARRFDGGVGIGARQNRHAGAGRGAAGRDLVAEELEQLGARTDEDESGFAAQTCKSGVLAQEAVARWIASQPARRAASMICTPSR